MVQCNSCKQWLHGSCLEKAALEGFFEIHEIGTRNQIVELESNASNIYTAESDTDSSDSKTRITITNERPIKSVNVGEVTLITCLLCGESIEGEEESDINGTVDNIVELRNSDRTQLVAEAGKAGKTNNGRSPRAMATRSQSHVSTVSESTSSLAVAESSSAPASSETVARTPTSSVTSSAVRFLNNRNLSLSPPGEVNWRY
jgi:hypothetical protein